MRPIAYRFQRTLAKTADVQGVGFISGARVRLRFRPAVPDTGIVFARADLPGTPLISARASSVTDTRRRTTIGPAKTGVTLVEHVLSALSGLRIDNCLIELDGPEPPGLDGSALGFVNILTEAGAVIQSARRPVLSVSEPVSVERDGACITLHPSVTPSLQASYLLDYGQQVPIPRQSATVIVTPESYRHQISDCRTFLLEHEAHELRKQGIGKHLKASEVLVFGAQGPIENQLRYADEPARHKLLDLIGDLALCGFDLAGHIVAYRSGHALNIELANRLSHIAWHGSPPLSRTATQTLTAKAA